MDPAPREDNYSEEDKTQLVDLDSLRSGGNQQPQFAPPPTMDSMPAVSGPATAEDKTELFEIPAEFSNPGGNSGGGGVTSSAPDYGGGYNNPGQQSPPGGNYGAPPSAPNYGPQSGGQGHPQGQGQYGHYGQSAPVQSSAPPPVQSSAPGGSFSSVGGGFDSGPAAPAPGRSREQVVIPADGKTSHDGATAFINIAEFAEQEAHFTPEQQQAGYDGSTQFVDVNALMAGQDSGAGGGGDPIDNDEELHRGYQFSADDIHREGDITLIDAKNALGMPVLLKRIWEGRPEEMSTPLRERLAQLNELKHPNLQAMNGMFVSNSGMWVELEAQRGQCLSKIVSDGGPLPVESALEILSQAGQVLDTIHDHELAYANLTADAIWVDPKGRVQVEPFDMLKLADRGDLGAYGPPEMEAPPDRRQLSPASDVYSLAAVFAATITGVPLRPALLADFDDQKVVAKLQAALHPDPAERPQSCQEFIDEFRSGGGLDIKIVGAGIFAALFIGVAAFAMLGDDSPPPPPPEQASSEQAVADESADDGGESQQAPAAQARDLPDVEMPGSYTTDPRLTVTTSFRLNPPADAITLATDEQLQEWRVEVEELIEAAEAASEKSSKLKHYADALELLGRLIRKQDSPGDDLETWREIHAVDIVQEEIKAVVESVREPLLEGRIGTANRRYARLAAIDPGADATSFLSSNNNATIIELTRDGADDD